MLRPKSRLNCNRCDNKNFDVKTQIMFQLQSHCSRGDVKNFNVVDLFLNDLLHMHCWCEEFLQRQYLIITILKGTI